MPDAAARILATTDPAAALGALVANTAAHGLTHVSVGHAPAPGEPRLEAFFHTTWPKAWFDLYAGQAVVREDPVVARARRDPAPFTWRDIASDLTDWRLTGDGPPMLDLAARFGWTAGFVVPVHGHAGEVGIVAYAGTGDLTDPTARIAVQTLSIVAYLHPRGLHGRILPPDPGLTARERDVLALLARGLTDAQVAERLGITPRTVLAHVATAKDRLRAATRTQAVAEAVARGLI
ncbi:MAG: LuxR family transcriptional regulator [Rhodobacteraceae bacterium]|jgi:LuxR family quorum sensing-dependent transcriptional regulator|nr:LuxR family transcriptional regulator [Paracoccaceae bacterium]